jgi:hypothetical protein
MVFNEWIPEVTRRGFIRLVGGCVVGMACLSFRPCHVLAQSTRPRDSSIGAWSTRIRRILANDRLPIIDTQATYWRSIDIATVVGWMEENAVAQIAFAPNFSLGSATSLRLHDQYPEYFIPTTADASSWHWDQNPQQFIDTVVADFQSGGYFLMEYEMRHYPSPMQWRAGQMNRDVTIPLDSKPVHDLFRFSEQRGVAFLIHYEIEDGLLPPLEQMLARYPGARVVWAHLGQVRYPDRAKRYNPDYIQSLIARFPNLHFDLGSMVFPGHVYPASGARDMILFEFTGSPPYGGYLKREWRNLFEAHPDRFLAASDIDGGRWKQFPTIIARLRNLILEQLNERSRHLIAYRNAWRLVTGEEWRS